MPRPACPRCGLSLSRQTYEGVEVDMCQECWGVWLDKGELEQIAKSGEYSFSQEERSALRFLLTPGKPSPEGGKTVPCPHCGASMQRARYAKSTSIWIDHCVEHGIWLDAKEIKAIQAYHEQRGEDLGDDSFLGSLGRAGG